MEIVSSGLIYRNPQPHLRAIHAWFPSLALLDDGEMVASFDLGQAVEGLDCRTYLSRSRNGGHDWTPPVRLFEDPVQRRSTHTVRISNVGNGTLVGFGGRLYRDDPEEGLVNRANLGYVPMDLILVESRDGGHRWTGPTTIEPPVAGPFEICHPIRQLRDGRWLAPTSNWKTWDGQTPNGLNAMALVSHDRGRTWPEAIWVMRRYDQGITSWEQSITELPDGRLLAVAWAVEEQSGKTLPTPYSIASDGIHFAPPRPTGLHGQTARVMSLGDDRILCVYRRHDKPGLWASLARIDGDTWVNLDEQALWQGAVSGMRGEAAIGDELGSLKFGCPSLLRLPDGEVFVAFWCLEDSIHNIRWMRIRV